MEYPPFTEQSNAFPGTFSLADFGAEFQQQHFNVSPPYVSASRMAKNCVQGALVSAFHRTIVPYSGITNSSNHRIVTFGHVVMSAQPVAQTANTN